ncbi:hypothetical protein [Coleofasciculus sp.]|uniref:hypothetical protein n=1 Tax=Coleofasciculus sp. TaxID=3100458 RepID=UPI003A2DDBB9
MTKPAPPFSSEQSQQHWFFEHGYIYIATIDFNLCHWFAIAASVITATKINLYLQPSCLRKAKPAIAGSLTDVNPGFLGIMAFQAEGMRSRPTPSISPISRQR